MLVSEFHDEIAGSRSLKTAEAYGKVVRLFVGYVEKRSISVEKLAQEHFDGFIAWLVENDYQPSYVHLAGIGVSIYLKWLKSKGKTEVEFKIPKLPKIPRINPLSISPEQLLRYSRAARIIAEPYSTALLLLPLSGLRSEEMCEMPINSVRVEEGWVIFSVVGKFGKEREVPLLKNGNDFLSYYMNGWRKAFGKSKWLFPSPVLDDKPIAMRVMRRWMEKISKNVGFQVTAHMMRRTYLTLLSRQGVSMKRVAELAGHESEETTRKHYITRSARDLFKFLEHVDIRM